MIHSLIIEITKLNHKEWIWWCIVKQASKSKQGTAGLDDPKALCTSYVVASIRKLKIGDGRPKVSKPVEEEELETIDFTYVHTLREWRNLSTSKQSSHAGGRRTAWRNSSLRLDIRGRMLRIRNYRRKDGLWRLFSETLDCAVTCTDTGTWSTIIYSAIIHPHVCQMY